MSKRISKNQQTAQHDHLEPVFIHSLWRAGSTYLFSVFRRSSAGYWCYQEPVHEIALLSKDKPGELLAHTGERMAALRHPPLAEPYFLELHETSKYWSEVISKPIIYDDYFGGVSNGGLTKYLSALITHAKGRPVIQECRTSCRIGMLKRALGGTHIYLWRNPWDQWWSYKSTNYFDITNQLILNAPGHPEVITRLRNEIGFAEFHDEDISKEFAYFDRKRMSAENSYLTFYLLWCLGLLEGMGSADLLLNIDKLSAEQAYRDDIQKHLLQFGVEDINFSDCNVPQAYYAKSDRAFFSSQEERAHVLLIMSGYSKAKLKKLAVLRQSSEPKIWAISASKIPAEKLLSDSVRAREIVLRTESENAARLVYSAALQVQEIRLHEQIFAEKLAVQRQHTALENAEREQSLHSELATLRETLSRAQIAAAEREKALSGLAQQTLEKARNEAQTHLREIVERERNYSNQLAQVQSDTKQSAAEQARAHADETSQIRQELENLLYTQVKREQEVAAQLLAIQQQAAQEMAEQAKSHREQERALQRQYTEREQTFAQQLQAGQQELRRLLQVRAQREQEIAAQLLVIQQQANKEMAEQTKSHREQELALQRQHAEREHSLAQQLQAGQQELRRLLQVRAQREQEVAAQLLAIQQQAAQETAEQLLAIQQQAAQEMAEQARSHSEQERALQCQHAVREQSLHHAQQLQAQQHSFEISTKQEEHNHLIESAAALEAELKAQIQAEQQASLLLRQTLAEVQKSLETTHASLIWRMTRPLRSLAHQNDPGATSSVTGKVAPEHAIMPTVIESPPANIEQVPIEANMLPSASASSPNTSAIAATLHELLARYDQAFVICAYQTLLGRNPDPDGMKYYLGRLRTGFSKLQIVAQLRLSKEGSARAVNLPGLDIAIQHYQRGQYPLAGWLFMLLDGTEGNHPTERKLRAIENQIFLLSAESNRRFNQTEAALSGLQHLVLQQTQSVTAVHGGTPQTNTNAATIAHVKPPEPDGLEHLSSRARGIYFQLKTAAAGHARRAA